MPHSFTALSRRSLQHHPRVPDRVPSAQDRELLDAWRAGDRFAGNSLLRRHSPALRRFFERRAGTAADDLLQRTMLACVESHKRIRGEACLRTYLFVIARHELYRYFRERARFRRLEDSAAQQLLDDASSILDEFVLRQDVCALEQAMGRLSAEDRRMLELSYAEGLDSGALGTLFGLAPGSVRARLHRARARLERDLRSRLG